MKNILKIFVLIFVTGLLSSCEPDEYDVPDVDLTPVYQISETGNKAMFTINIYKEMNKLFVWNKDGMVSMYTTQNYLDSSTENTIDEATGETVYGEYIVTVTALENKIVTDENGNESTVTISHDYSLTANKETGAASILITTTDENAAVSTSSVNGIIAEEEVYN